MATTFWQFWESNKWHWLKSEAAMFKDAGVYMMSHPSEYINRTDRVIIHKDSYATDYLRYMTYHIRRVWTFPLVRMFFDFIVPPINLALSYIFGFGLLGVAAYAGFDNDTCDLDLKVWTLVAGMIHLFVSLFPLARLFVTTTRLLMLPFNRMDAIGKSSINHTATIFDLMTMFFSVFLNGWYIVGASWLLASSEEVFYEKESSCPQYLYWAIFAVCAFWVIRAFFCVLFIGFLASIFGCCCGACLLENLVFCIPKFGWTMVNFVVYYLMCCMCVPGRCCFWITTPCLEPAAWIPEEIGKATHRLPIVPKFFAKLAGCFHSTSIKGVWTGIHSFIGNWIPGRESVSRE